MWSQTLEKKIDKVFDSIFPNRIKYFAQLFLKVEVD